VVLVSDAPMNGSMACAGTLGSFLNAAGASGKKRPVGQSPGRHPNVPFLSLRTMHRALVLGDALWVGGYV
jgi:hypothetical protein